MGIKVSTTSKLQDPDFIFGVATAAFQIEGGADKRLPCIWDTFCDQDGTIEDGSNGQTACDHFHLWEQDINLIDQLNVDAYRLSLSWPRLIKECGSLNQDGLTYYKDILTTLKEKDIKAFVTFYHWDLPQYIEDRGGWLNRETAYKFQSYVDIVSKELKGLVYSYATLNEPFCSAYLGYETGIHAPGKSSIKEGRQAAHTLMLAHGLGMKALQKNSPETENGIVLNMSPCYPLSQSNADIQAAKNANDYLFNWYLQPLLQGEYPEIFNELSDNDQPDIHDGDMEIICHKIDFLGLNYYTREIYKDGGDALYEPVNSKLLPLTDMEWEVYPQGLTDLLVGLHQTYTVPPIYITENGAAMPNDAIVDGHVHDPERRDYLNTHINAVDAAINQGVNIKGYFAWSLLDNFEWSFGYEKRFGIIYVDYTTQQRVVKDSGKAYADFLLKRKKR